MQKKALVLTGITFLIAGGVFFSSQTKKIDRQVKTTINKTAISQKNETAIHSRSIFVPYWATKLDREDEFDTYYYFGITPNVAKPDAIDTSDPGFQHISLVKSIPVKQKKLVLRLLNPSVTEVILGGVELQKRLTEEVVQTLDDFSFSGIVIDLEVPFTLQSEKQKQISQFVQEMCTGAHSNYKTCDVLVYGDFSYRKRPYDLKKIGEIADKILLMAYDFHKAGGEPGPNYPFDSGSKNSPSLRASPLNEIYGYDFKQMISDAVSLVPKNKIEVVFGMYGYDWTMNDQGIPLKNATAHTLKEIQLKVESLKLKVQSNTSKEKKIEYTDEKGNNHIIWYEDEESAAVKTKYLESQGIFQTSFWALSYF